MVSAPVPAIVVETDMQARVGARFEFLPTTANLEGTPEFQR